MGADSVQVTLDVLRCKACQRLLFDQDVQIHHGCPHCGARAFTGVGKTTPEETVFLEQRALKYYDDYRDLEIRDIAAREGKTKHTKSVKLVQITPHERTRKVF